MPALADSATRPAGDRSGRGAIVLALFFGEALLDDDAWYRGKFALQPVVRLLSLIVTWDRLVAMTKATIKSQAFSIYRKLGTSSRSQAVTRARELRLLDG